LFIAAYNGWSPDDTAIALVVMMSRDEEQLWLHQLLDVGRTLTSELDQRVVLERVLETAREITGAGYAALGVLNEDHSELERFLTSGIDEQARTRIGELPHGRGVLGVLIEHPQPLRLPDVREHPSSYGFPAGHPPMRSFLGVPIMIHGRAWGNLYLTEKAEGDFTDRDEDAAVILAQWAAIAIENARLYALSEQRREVSEKASRGLRVSRDVAVAVGGEVALDRVLELIVKRARSLVDARSALIWLREGEDLVLAARTGDAAADALGLHVPIAGTVAGGVLESKRSHRLLDMARRRGPLTERLGLANSQSALLVPMLHRGEAVGVLIVFDGEDGFDEDAEHLLHTFATSAATAVALAKSVQADRLRGALAAADAERRRWARELHDDTLQGLGALQLLLSGAMRHDGLPRIQQAIEESVVHVEREIKNLRAIITDLRPASLDQLGLRAALESLFERYDERGIFKIASELSISSPSERRTRLDPELENTVFRLVQEALTNVSRHAHASTVHVRVCESANQIEIEVQDNGAGFDAGIASTGYGVAGMRERASLAGGSLQIASSKRGTAVRATLPVQSSARPA
jgi:signal transduction histidine kinase